MKNKLSILIMFMLSLFLMGCGNDIVFDNTPDSNNTNDENKTLKANAGIDQNITVDTPIKIVGKVIVGDRDIGGYSWKEGSVLLSWLKKFDYISSKPGKHTLTFTVYDSNDKNASDEMIVTVKEVNASK